MRANKGNLGDKSTALRAQALQQEIILVSQPGLAALKAKIPQLRDQHKDLLKALGSTIEDYPDVRENTTYDFLKHKIEADLPADLYDVKEKLTKARVYRESLADAIGFGDKFLAASDAGEDEYFLLGPIEANENFMIDGVGTVSYLSPLGQAVWGIKSGSQASVKLPSGTRVFTFTRVGSLDTP